MHFLTITRAMESKSAIIILKYNNKEYSLKDIHEHESEIDYFLDPVIHHKFISIMPLLNLIEDDVEINMTIIISNVKNNFKYVVEGNCPDELKKRIIEKLENI